MPRVLDTNAVNKKRRASDTSNMVANKPVISKTETKDGDLNSSGKGGGNEHDLKSPLFDILTPQVSRWTSPKILDKLQIKYQKLCNEDILSKAGIEPLSESGIPQINDLLVTKKLLQRYVSLDASISDIEKDAPTDLQKYLTSKIEDVKANYDYILENTPSIKKEITVLTDRQRGKGARALVYAREFIEKITALLKFMQEKKQVYENMYKEAFFSFAQMCLLFPLMGDGTKRPQIIRGQTVLSVPDARFLRQFTIHLDQPRIGLVASVAVEPSAKPDDSGGLPAPFSVRHAGELLSEVNGSPPCPYTIGIAVQKTMVTFTCFISQPSYIDKLRDAMETLTPNDTATIYYSPSYDMLSSNDRDELITTMLRLSSL